MTFFRSAFFRSKKQAIKMFLKIVFQGKKTGIPEYLEEKREKKSETSKSFGLSLINVEKK